VWLTYEIASTYVLASASGYPQRDPHLQQFADNNKRGAFVRLEVHQDANQARDDSFSRALLVEGRMTTVSRRWRAKNGRPLHDVAHSITFDAQRHTFCAPIAVFIILRQKTPPLRAGDEWRPGTPCGRLLAYRRACGNLRLWSGADDQGSNERVSRSQRLAFG